MHKKLTMIQKFNFQILLFSPLCSHERRKKTMFDTLLAMLMSAIFAYQLGLYHGAKWSTNNFKKSKKSVDKRRNN